MLRKLLLSLLLIAGSALAQEEAESAAATVAPDARQPVAEQPAPQPDPGLTIEEAYQKEFAFLEAQRQDLERRIAASRERFAAEQSALRGEVNALQATVVNLDARVGQLQESVTEAEEKVIANAKNREVLAATFQQAGSTLEQYGIDALDSEAFAGAGDAARIRILFEQGDALVRELGAISRTQGVFYAQDGHEVSGEILKIGNIAAYGRAGDVAGVLAPAGGNRFKIWPEDTAEATRAIMEGSGGAMIPIFLFESLAREIEAQADKTVLDVINDGGTIGWVIVVLGAIALVMIVLRIAFLQRSSTSVNGLCDKIEPMVRSGRQEDAIDYLARQNNSPSRVMRAEIRNLDRDRDHIEDIVSEAILHESGHLNRFGTAILVIAAVAPLLGLLGTVTGMIATFDIITEFGTGDPKLLSGGIAIALVTTELGLIVAIPTLLVGNLLSGWSDKIKDNMEAAALRVINVGQDRKLDLKAAA
ncbi:MAG: MotA/TolQ/ExbB proton channel family protein [Xanthomonadales bacterium]|nr:MotA/TolQ/ExbB proton channel family protein [Xanthomonadales bacterium]